MPYATLLFAVAGIGIALLLGLLWRMYGGTRGTTNTMQQNQNTNALKFFVLALIIASAGYFAITNTSQTNNINNAQVIKQKKAGICDPAIGTVAADPTKDPDACLVIGQDCAPETGVFLADGSCAVPPSADENNGDVPNQ